MWGGRREGPQLMPRCKYQIVPQNLNFSINSKSWFHMETKIPSGAVVRESTYQCRRRKRRVLDPWVGKIPWGGNGNPLQYSCLENPMDRGVLLFSCYILSMRSNGLQHARLPCSLSPRVCSNSWPLSWWCHPTISVSVIPFSCPQSCPASESFPTSQLFASDGQRIAASASVLLNNIQGWFPIVLTGFISLCPKRTSRVFSVITIQNHQFFSSQPSLWSNSHICTCLLKNRSFD